MTEWFKDALGIKGRKERECERVRLEKDLAQIDFRMRLAVCGIRNRVTTRHPSPPVPVAK